MQVELLRSDTALLDADERSRAGWVNGSARAGIDRALAFLMLVVALPIIGFAMLAVRLDSRGAAMFRQTRVGRDGDHFTILKLRTMTDDAEARLEELREENEAAGPLFKMAADPRVTRVGAFLRKTSLDELPQLVNVVRGEMSLVGPRPALPDEVEEFDALRRRRLEVKPGLTGLWQVSGRSDLSDAQATRLDLQYLRGWNIVDDGRVLLATVAAVLTRRGAY